MVTYFNLLESLINTDFANAISVGGVSEREYIDSIFSAIDSFAETNNDVILSSRLTELESKLAFYFKDKGSGLRLNYVKTAFYYLTEYLAEKIKTPKEIGLNIWK